jgi:hypothetical protein
MYKIEFPYFPVILLRENVRAHWLEKISFIWSFLFRAPSPSYDEMGEGGVICRVFYFQKVLLNQINNSLITSMGRKLHIAFDGFTRLDQISYS